jgi:hypothetical protein
MRKTWRTVAFTAEVLAILALPAVSVAAVGSGPVAYASSGSATSVDGDGDADVTNGTLNVGSGPG